MESTVLSSFGGNLAAMALAGGLYFGFRILKRSKCQSHNQCCDFEVSKAETERDDRMFMRILASIRKEDGTSPLPLDHARADKGRPGEEGSLV